MTPDFEDWMIAVDRRVEATIGLSVHDLTDHPFYDWWEDSVTPVRAAKRVVSAALRGD